MRTTALVLTGILLFAGAGAARGAEGTEEIVKLAQSGLSEDVLVAYVQASPAAYDLSADDLVYLNDLGIPQQVIAAMLSHGKELRDRAADTATGQTPGPAPLAAETPAAPGAAPVEGAGAPAIQAAPGYEGTPMAEPAGDPGLQIARSAPVTSMPAGEAAPVYEAAPISVLASDPGVQIVRSTPLTLAPADDNADISYFYQSLAPYGSWVSEPDYGWAWQPTAVTVDPSWQPYRQGGHWVWTDYGWYWQSNYTWGWAPFHYGRWAYSPRHRWVWVPDNVWGPSWVSWRSSDDAFGWAPLPPGATWDVRLGFSFHGEHVGFDFDFHLGHDHFTFVPRRRFLERNLGSVALPRQQVVNIFNHTTIVNHTYVYNDNRIIVQGIPVQSVAQVTQRKIEPRHVVDLHPAPGKPLTRARVANDQIAAYRPKLHDKAAADPPTVLARRAAELERQRRQSGAPVTGPVTTQPNHQKTGPVATARPTEPGKPAKPPVVIPPAKPNEIRNGGTVEAGRLANPPSKDQADALRRKQQDEAARKQQDAARKLAEQQAQNAQRAKEQEAARRQQDEAARKQQDAARKLAEQQAQNAQRAKEQEAARRQQDEAARKDQAEALRRKQQDEALRKQQDATRKLAEQQAQNAQRAKEQEAARRQQDEAARKQQDAARKLAEQQAQNAQRAKDQEAARRQQDEAARRQQDAAHKLAEQQAQNAQRAKEQETARRQQDEAARRLQEAARREQQVRTPAPQRPTPPAPPASVRSAPPSAPPANDPRVADDNRAKGRGRR